jgi:uncharacterized protein (DUF58 family)
VDWNIYGRLERLFVKLFEEEQDLHVSFLVDASASMRWRSPAAAPARLSTLNSQLSTKLDQARRVAASLAYIALANLDRVNIHYFGADLLAHMGVARGKAQFHKVLDFLRPEPAGGGSATRLLTSVRSFVQRVRRRGLVFILSDLFDPQGYEEPLSLLRYNQFEVQLVHVLDPAERDPALLGDLRLTDAETALSFDVTADETLLARYRAEIAQFIERIENFCLQRGLGCVQASTAVPFEDLVLRVLRAGRLVK